MQYVYSMLDRKMKEFGQLIFTRSDDAILRILADSLEKPSSVSAHPEDYDLFCVGQFDELTGEIARMPVRMIANARDVMNARKLATEVRDG